MGWPAAVLWNGAILYVTLGFRQFSHHFTGIRDALESGDEERARLLLASWQSVDASELPRREIVRHVIEFSVLAAHRHVFGVLAWYSVLAAFGLGPAGAVLYRISEFVRRYWRYKGALVHQPTSTGLQMAAGTAWRVMDWVPARLTALAFAVVGSFEEAIDSWRQQAQQFPDDNDGVILAATSGAINVRLGGEALRNTVAVDATQPGRTAGAEEGTPGRTPEVAHLAQVVGLVWRSVVMWLVLLALLTLARLLG
jgi:adenosylcobinamide-phosphate synthase